MKYIYTFPSKKIDIYIFVLCDQIQKKIKYISTKLNISSIPQKIMSDIEEAESKNRYIEKTLYTDTCKVILYIITDKQKCNNETIYRLFGEIGVKMRQLQTSQRILIHLCQDSPLLLKNQIISYILGYYKLTDFKSVPTLDKTITFFYHPLKKKKEIIQSSIYEATIQNEIRTLINTPANILDSTTFYKYIRKNRFKDINITCYSERQMQKMGCNLILAVNQGSMHKPYLVVLEYKNNPVPNRNIVMIGKGVMFDSGGYSIKHGDFSDMKNDMTGSAIVYGLFQLLSTFNVQGHFYGILPLVENMVDSNAIRPGDIIRAYNGMTVEITNTDAEGRLIMADALAFSKQFNPYICIDIATLTGQASSIFDHKSSIIMGNHNKYIQKMIQAGIENNEKIWELPMWKEYIDATKSNIADIKNSSYESKAGTIMAGAFLSHFVPSSSHWIHLDIAGVDNLKKNSSMRHYGASGEIMRTVFSFLQYFHKEVYTK